MKNTERIKADVKRLHNQGVNLLNAMRNEQFPEKMEEYFKTILKKDYNEFKQSLPVFGSGYQSWYAETMSLIKILLPLRLNDFIRLYERPKNRKEITKDNYVVEDYLNEVVITTGFDKKIVAGPEIAIPVFQQQFNIFSSIQSTLDSSLLDIKRELQSELLDAELDKAALLVKHKQLRAAGAVVGIVLEKHLEQVCNWRQLRPARKSPTIEDYNEELKKSGTIDFPDYRHIGLLAELYNFCVQNKKRDPEPSEIADLINGTDKIIKTVF